MPTLPQVIVWLVVGGLSGSFVGALLTGKKAGYGFWKNLAIGLMGALLGGLVFHLFKIDLLGLQRITVNAQDLLAAILGCLVVVVVVKLWPKKKAPAA